MNPFYSSAVVGRHSEAVSFFLSIPFIPLSELAETGCEDIHPFKSLAFFFSSSLSTVPSLSLSILRGMY